MRKQQVIPQYCGIVGSKEKFTSPPSSPLLQERGFCIAVLSFSLQEKELEG